MSISIFTLHFYLTNEGNIVLFTHIFFTAIATSYFADSDTYKINGVAVAIAEDTEVMSSGNLRFEARDEFIVIFKLIICKFN